MALGKGQSRLVRRQIGDRQMDYLYELRTLFCYEIPAWASIRLAQAIEMRDDGNLVRDRAVEASEPHGPRTADGIAQVGWIHLDGQITPGQAVVVVGGLDHRLGRVLGNRFAETGGEFLLEIERRGHGFTSAPIG